MTTPRITAAICTYDRYELLEKAVASLTRQSLGAEDFEILVIDNSPAAAESTRRSKPYLGIANLRWAVEKTPGLSNARNAATSLASAPIIAFMDDDAIADRSWLEMLLSAFSEFGESANVVGGRVDPIWGVPRPAWLPDNLLGYVSVVNWGGNARYAAESEWVAGTNIAFRVKALQDIGGFPVHLGRNRGGQALLSNDESDVVQKLAATGSQLIYAPAAAVSHLVPAERLNQSWFRRRAAWQAVSDYLLDPAGSFEKAAKYWPGVTEYYALLPPKYRTPRGLYVDHAEPDMVHKQMSALYNFTLAALSGFHGIEGGKL
jgi:glycosyltransferase involved in cell wall biosynthesis